MYDDLYALFLFWKERTGRSSVLDFADAVFEATNVPLSDLLTETERAHLLSVLGSEALLEGMEGGP